MEPYLGIHQCRAILDTMFKICFEVSYHNAFSFVLSPLASLVIIQVLKFNKAGLPISVRNVVGVLRRIY